MLAALIEAAGFWFVIAVALEAAATMIEVAGAARSPEEDAPRRGFAALVILAMSALTPGLLLLHGFVSTAAAEPLVRALGIGAPAAALLGGGLAGGAVGALARGWRDAMRRLALPVGVAALAATIYAALPSVTGLFANSGTIVLPPL